jgi:hypothetical protein
LDVTSPPCDDRPSTVINEFTLQTLSPSCHRCLSVVGGVVAAAAVALGLPWIRFFVGFLSSVSCCSSSLVTCFGCGAFLAFVWAFSRSVRTFLCRVLWVFVRVRLFWVNALSFFAHPIWNSVNVLRMSIWRNKALRIQWIVSSSSWFFCGAFSI